MFDTVRTLQLDVTTVCQAACPACARETDATFDPSVRQHLSVERILASFPEHKIKHLHKMYMCGQYGEPAAGLHTQEIFRFFRDVNPDITLGMNTNGGVQSTSWWKNLAEILNRDQDYCVFSIDGLSDTNHVYRRNVNWNNVMSNAKSFICAGGIAHWDMLVYRHNQHQVDACQELARDMGFRWFRAKVSKRAYVAGLEFPLGWRPVMEIQGPIKCYAMEHELQYMDAYGNISPCCWHGMTHSQDAQVKKLEQLSVSWNTENPDPVCREACSVNVNETRFASQWQREIQLR